MTERTLELRLFDEAGVVVFVKNAMFEERRSGNRIRGQNKHKVEFDSGVTAMLSKEGTLGGRKFILAGAPHVEPGTHLLFDVGSIRYDWVEIGCPNCGSKFEAVD